MPIKTMIWLYTSEVDMPWFIPLIIAGGIAIIALAVITIKKIRKWINENKTGIGKEKVEIIKEKIANGDYKLIVGVYKRKAVLFKNYSGNASFEGKKIDDDLYWRLGNRKRTVMDVDEF